MYTVCWIENGEDKWDRCESRIEVVALLLKHGIQDNEDVLIFTPDADDCTITAEDLFATL